MLLELFQYFERFMLLFITPECYDIFFVDYDLLHGSIQTYLYDVLFAAQCVKAAISKGLGVGIVTGSVLVKVPQIVKIVKNRNGKGISIIGQLLELYGIISTVAYSMRKRFPFSAWGDGLFMLIQTATIIALVIYFKARPRLSFVFISNLCLTFYLLTSNITPVNVLWAMQAVSVPIMFVGKIIQAYSNYQCKTMGQQSLSTCALLFLGSMARVFTSVQETGDVIIILTYVLASLANGIILSQFFIYKDKQEQRTQKTREKKKQ